MLRKGFAPWCYGTCFAWQTCLFTHLACTSPFHILLTRDSSQDLGRNSIWFPRKVYRPAGTKSTRIDGRNFSLIGGRPAGGCEAITQQSTIQCHQLVSWAQCRAAAAASGDEEGSRTASERSASEGKIPKWAVSVGEIHIVSFAYFYRNCIGTASQYYHRAPEEASLFASSPGWRNRYRSGAAHLMVGGGKNGRKPKRNQKYRRYDT